MRRHDKVKGPILIPFSLVLLLAVGALLVTAYQYEEQARRHDLATSVRAVERLFELQIANDAAKLHATLCPISRDDAVKHAFLSGDREALLARTGPLFERLRDQHRVTHFYILDAERRVVLRVHQPDLHGDIIARTTTLQAEQTGTETQGIELGPLGTLTLRAVKPWLQDGRLIGCLELGEEIDHVSREIHEVLGVDLLVLVHRRFLAPEGQPNAADDSDRPLIVSNSLGDLPPAVVARLQESRHAAGGAEQSFEGGQSLYTAVLPLRDAGGREIGVNMAQFAQREADDPVRVRQLLGDIRQAGNDCQAFIQRMLAFTRVSRSERKPTDIGLLIHDTIDLFQQSTDRHPVITTELPQSPLILDIDPVLIRHALFNLLANAAQANAPGGAIRVRLQPAIGADQRSGRTLAVIDQGPGLSEEVREKLFTPFFTTRPSGTGLGLAVVQHVAALHDGSASGENQPGGGAVFALWLPTIAVDPGKAT